MKKFLCIVVIAVFMLCMGCSVAFAADKLDTEDVKEIKIASIAASYRDAPLHGENVKDIEKGEKIYIIDYIYMIVIFKVIYLFKRCNYMDMRNEFI